MKPEDAFLKELPTAAAYLRNGWPAQVHPDHKDPPGWDVSLVAGTNIIHHHAPSPDGKTILFAWNINDQSDLYAVNDDGWPRRLTFDRKISAPWSDSQAAWSPDGSRFAFCQKGGIWVAEMPSGAIRRLTDPNIRAGSPRWINGQSLLCTVNRDDRDQLFRVEIGQPWPRPLVANLSGDIMGMRPSPDGKLCVFVFQPEEDLHTASLYIADLESGEAHRIRQDDGYALASPRWHPNGKWILYRTQRSGWWDLAAVRPNGDGDHTIFAPGCDVEGYSLTQDGSTLAAVTNRAGSFSLQVLSDLAEDCTVRGNVRAIDTPPGYLHNIHFLPDGSLTCEWESPTHAPEIYLVEPTSGKWKQRTFAEPPTVSSLHFVFPEPVSFSSEDGLEIPSFLYRPAKPNGAAIVHPHGGPTSQHVPDWDPFIQYFVALGYTWLAPNFRGSTGYGLAFQRKNEGVWGVKDTADCVSAGNWLANQPGIDANRLGIYGASYGSYMSVCALVKEPDRFACGVAKFGDCDILASWAQSDRIGRLDVQKQMGHPKQTSGAYRAGSPVWEADRMRRPLFLGHGLKDDRVVPLQSEQLVETLTRLGKTFEYVTYANEGHGFFHAENAIHFTKMVRRFLNWYLI